MQVNELSYTSIHIQIKREKVPGEWRELNIEELMILSPNIIWVIKQRKKRSVSHVVCTGDKRNSCRVFVGKPEERDNLDGQYIYGRTIIRKISKKHDGLAWIRLM
jgi:hypothetical protein